MTSYPEAYGTLVAALCAHHPGAARSLAQLFERRAATPGAQLEASATRRALAADLRRELAWYEDN